MVNLFSVVAIDEPETDSMGHDDAMMAEHLDRRAALQVGTGLFGLSLPSYLAAARAGQVLPDRREYSCLFLFLAGGISHFESWDPKPDAPVGIRGLWNPQSTNVPGTFITEKMPLLAQMMDKVAIVRSWKGNSGSHGDASKHVMSGVSPRVSGQQFYPNFGCIASTLLGGRRPGIPSYVGVPVAARYTSPTGFLGPAYAAFDIGGDPNSRDFKIDGLRLPRDRFETRRSLLDQIDNLGRLAAESSTSLTVHDDLYQEAVTTLTSGAIQRAANLEEEPLAIRQKYGLNIYGQRALLARRMIEAGARFVTVNHAVQGGLFGKGKTNGTWDNHGWLFDSMMSFASRPAAVPKKSTWHNYKGPGNLPQLDMSLTSLLTDLEERGLLDTTLVVAMGEFGRTPKINKTAGRDHYPRAGNVLLAGAGVKGGVVIGATDRNGAAPSTRAWSPADFGASIYHALGIDAETTFLPRLPRPTKLSDGKVIDGLFA
ncbi:MAG: hypothetical protein CMJ65_01965 [Planctomycetaceae bacterium]|jgi:hypothetical protein|nr:hypothetical protein [Planctomycetaceae bacterium]